MGFKEIVAFVIKLNWTKYCICDCCRWFFAEKRAAVIYMQSRFSRKRWEAFIFIYYHIFPFITNYFHLLPFISIHFSSISIYWLPLPRTYWQFSPLIFVIILSFVLSLCLAHAMKIYSSNIIKRMKTNLRRE